VLLALGEWNLAQEVLDLAGTPAADPVRAEVRAAQRSWSAEAAVRVTSIETRRAALGIDSDPEPLTFDDSTSRPEAETILREAEAALQRHEDELAQQLLAEASRRHDAASPSHLSQSIESAIGSCRLTAARRLLNADRTTSDDTWGWPAARDSTRVALPEAFSERFAWPWQTRSAAQCLGWFSAGESASRPIGFDDRWLPTVTDEQAEQMLAAMRRAEAEPTPDARAQLLAQALAIGLDARIADDHVRLDDAALAMFDGLAGPLAVRPYERSNVAGGITLTTAAKQELTISWADLFGSLAAGRARRVHLLRLICRQALPASASVWSADLSGGVSWQLHLSGLSPQGTIPETVARLGSGLPDIVSPLAAAVLAAAATTGVADLDAVHTGWQSLQFRDEACLALRRRFDQSSDALLVLRVAAAFDSAEISRDELVDMLDVRAISGDHGPAAWEKLCRAGIGESDEARIVLSPLMRRLTRHLFPIEL
jgi:hypothetical protein